jgi:hypothetical protein
MVFQVNGIAGFGNLNLGFFLVILSELRVQAMSYLQT